MRDAARPRLGAGRPAHLGRRVLRRHREQGLRGDLARLAALLPARADAGEAVHLGRHPRSRRRRDRQQRFGTRRGGAPLHAGPPRRSRRRVRQPRHLAARARTGGVRPCPRLHGSNHDRAGDRDVPRVAGPAVVDRGRSRGAGRFEPTVRRDPHAAGTDRSGARNPRPLDEGVRGPRRSRHRPGDRHRAST